MLPSNIEFPCFCSLFARVSFWVAGVDGNVHDVDTELRKLALRGKKSGWLASDKSKTNEQAKCVLSCFCSFFSYACHACVYTTTHSLGFSVVSTEVQYRTFSEEDISPEHLQLAQAIFARKYKSVEQNHQEQTKHANVWRRCFCLLFRSRDQRQCVTLFCKCDEMGFEKKKANH